MPVQWRVISSTDASFKNIYVEINDVVCCTVILLHCVCSMHLTELFHLWMEAALGVQRCSWTEALEKERSHKGILVKSSVAMFDIFIKIL